MSLTTAYPQPSLYQINIVWGDPRDPKFKNTFSILQLVADEADLESSIEHLTSQYQFVHEVTKVKLSIGFSPLFHDLFITGGAGIGIFED